MPDADDQHDELPILCLVHHTVASDPDAAQARKLPFEHTACAWMDLQLVYRGNDAAAVPGGDFGECLDGTLLNAD